MLGDPEPAHATAPGKPLLAHRQLWRDSVFGRLLQRHTDRTLTDPRDLHADVPRARTREYAIDNGERHEDVRALAAAVFLADEAVAALALSLSLTAADHATADAAAYTAGAVASLSAALSHR